MVNKLVTPNRCIGLVRLLVGTCLIHRLVKSLNGYGQGWLQSVHLAFVECSTKTSLTKLLIHILWLWRRDNYREGKNPRLTTWLKYLWPNLNEQAGLRSGEHRHFRWSQRVHPWARRLQQWGSRLNHPPARQETKAIGEKVTTTTIAMFSLKSVMNSLIGNLEEKT